MEKLKGYCAGFLVLLIWSGWIIASKIGIESNLTDYDLIALRFCISTVVLSPFIIKEIHKFNVFTPKYILLSLLGGILYLLFYFYGLKATNASDASVIVNGTLPVFSYFISILFLKQNRSFQKIIGIMLVSIANLILIGWSGFDIGIASLLLSALLLSLYTILIGLVPSNIKKRQTRILNYMLEPCIC